MNVTVFPHAGVCVVAKIMSLGCVSIPTLKMVETGNVEKLIVWTKSQIVIVNVLLVEATAGGG